ncbi:MAG: prolyl-tRNA synthetase associated domain-containing protein [Bacillota bacterium]
MMDPRELPVYEALKALNIPYERIEHEDARTMEDLTAVDERAGVVHCKNLFLCDRQRANFYLLLLGANKKFRTAEVSKQLGVARLSFAEPEYLLERLGLLPGAVTPMGLINDPERLVTVLVDEDLEKEEAVLVHPNVSTASIRLSVKDLFRYLNERGNRRIPVRVTSLLED